MKYDERLQTAAQLEKEGKLSDAIVEIEKAQRKAPDPEEEEACRHWSARLRREVGKWGMGEHAKNLREQAAFVGLPITEVTRKTMRDAADRIEQLEAELSEQREAVLIEYQAAQVAREQEGGG